MRAMAPSQRTHELVVTAMRDAAAEPEFCARLLMGAKTKGGAKETWLCARFAKAFTDAGFCVERERPDGHRGKIDIAILSREHHRLECVIEAKIYHCHQYRSYLKNTWKDFRKRE